MTRDPAFTQRLFANGDSLEQGRTRSSPAGNVRRMDTGRGCRS